MAEEQKKILIIEDEEPLLEALTIKFEKGGFSVLKAKNGEEGLIAAKNGEPDLIILDLVMPKMDGVKMMEELRKNDWGKKIPVIVLTNLNLDEMKILGKSPIPERVEKGQPAEYILKANIKLEDVVTKVKEVLLG